MDILFLAGGAALWGVMLLLAWGLERLEKKAGGRA